MVSKKGVNMQNVDKIRARISNNRLSHTWMIYQLHRRGIETDKTEFSGFLAGTRKGPKADQVIDAATDILDRYESVCDSF